MLGPFCSVINYGISEKIEDILFSNFLEIEGGFSFYTPQLLLQVEFTVQ